MGLPIVEGAIDPVRAPTLIDQLRWGALLMMSAQVACCAAFMLGVGADVGGAALFSALGAVAITNGAAVLALRRQTLAASSTIGNARLMGCVIALTCGLWLFLSGSAADLVIADRHLADGAALAGVAVILLAFPRNPLLLLSACGALPIQIYLTTASLASALLAVSLSALLLTFMFRRLNRDRSDKTPETDRAKAQRAARFIAEFEQSGRGWFWETNAGGALSYVSEQLAASLKTPAADLIGRNLLDLVDLDDKSSPDTWGSLGFQLSKRLPFSDINVRAGGAKEIWWALSGTPGFDENGEFLGFCGIGSDLTEQRRSDQEIARQARYDGLTGLPNRALIRRALEEALEADGGCALFLIDLDRFKDVNDTHGHPIGDGLLKQVARRLTSVIGREGQIGRLGGDEFEAVLTGTLDHEALGELANRLIQQVSMPYAIEGHNISIGASVGIAHSTPGDRPDAFTRNADLALYAAKSAGRGTYCFFAPEMHSEAQDRQLLEADLRKALARDELQLQYQPVVNAQTEALCGFEALVRWHHPTRGVVSPAVFIPLAEESGLILSIGEWVLRTACLEAAKWPEHIRVAVNLSPIQFVEPTLPALVMSAIAKSRILPRQLELEITEGIFLIENDATDDMFARLKNIGVRLALDDFGTGYSSLGYLKKAPFDTIKIDQSFVRGASNPGNRKAAIIRAIVTLAESLGMDTTAEGAETHDELTMIRELGCSQIQGYIFGRPMNPEDAGRLASENKAVTADGFQFNRPPRQGILKVASLQFNGMSMPVRVRNISIGGAMLECDRMLPLGSEVQLDLPGCGNLGAQVRWSEAKRMGIQFEDEFDLRRLAPGKAGTGPYGLARFGERPVAGTRSEADV